MWARKFILAFVACLYLAVTAGCQRHRFEAGDLKPIPVFQAVKDKHGKPIVITAHELRTAARKALGKEVRIHIYDASYALPTAAWFDTILAYQQYFMEDSELHPSNEKISSEFQAEFMVVFSSLASEAANLKAQPAIGLITWEPRKKSATWIDEREDAIAYTGKEFLVVHPATQQIMPLLPFLKTHRIINVEF